MSENLKLSNQICFPFYAISRQITKAYTPFLNELNLTYPQYLIMLVLWEKDEVLIKDICEKLILETNTISPILNTLEEKWFILKQKKPWNAKETFICLTEKWNILKTKAQYIPEKLLKKYDIENIDLLALHKNLWAFLEVFKTKN